MKNNILSVCPFLIIIVVLQANVMGVFAFTVIANSATLTSFLGNTCTTKSIFARSSKLQAIAVPAEQEDEKKKKKRADSNDDWTTTKGGFIPNILKKRNSTYPKVHLVDNIHDYKNIVAEEKDQIVVVRFFASWCRSCKTTKPLFNKLVQSFSDSSVKFVEVPLNKETAYLQEGLGVPSVPYAHIYHPEAGLVEEMKISKPHFSTFIESLRSYVVGSCDVPDEEDNIITDTIGSFE